jgi:hypothetical protein
MTGSLVLLRSRRRLYMSEEISASLPGSDLRGIKFNQCCLVAFIDSIVL